MRILKVWLTQRASVSLCVFPFGHSHFIYEPFQDTASLLYFSFLFHTHSMYYVKPFLSLFLSYLPHLIFTIKMKKIPNSFFPHLLLKYQLNNIEFLYCIVCFRKPKLVRENIFPLKIFIIQQRR